VEVNVHDLEAAYRSMVRMRAFDEAVQRGVVSGEIHGEMHVGIGQEAIAAGIEPLLTAADALVSTHRPHLHALAHGVDPVAMLAELFDRDGGLCRGRGGHMHLFDPSRDFMCTGIVGASVPIALGYAFQRRYRDESGVAVAVLGDGAVNIGAFAESLNLAALWRLPVVFLCEDNGYGISVPRQVATAGAIEQRGEPYGITGTRVDGTDVEQVHSAASQAFARARAGEPALLVATCYRWSGHYEGDTDHYRPQSEKDEAMTPDRDPLARLRARLVDGGENDRTLKETEAAERATVSRWVAEARAKPWPDPSDAWTGVFA
jgi:acetoin:2,6-dichlorophenolindophenol oxidoreductase subunit alpha